MAVIDASIWVAYFYDEDKFHHKAIEIIDKLSNTDATMRVPSLAFIEVAASIRRITKRENFALEALQSMQAMELDIWDIDSQRVEPCASSFATKFSCRGADACYIAVALLANDTLLSFDNTQNGCARNVVPVGEI